MFLSDNHACLSDTVCPTLAGRLDKQMEATDSTLDPNNCWGSQCPLWRDYDEQVGYCGLGGPPTEYEINTRSMIGKKI